jgi:hypothetical protein
MPRWPSYDPEGSFWEKVDRSGGKDACWIWTRYADTNGYGALKVWGKKVTAHRYSYELAYGQVPEGMEVCHRCNERLCVNPGHLYAGTRQQNVADMIAAGNSGLRPPPPKQGSDHPSAVLTEAEVIDIYQRAWSGGSQIQIAQEYGVSKHTISDIKHGKSWHHLTKHKRRRR